MFLPIVGSRGVRGGGLNLKRKGGGSDCLVLFVSLCLDGETYIARIRLLGGLVPICPGPAYQSLKPLFGFGRTLTNFDSGVCRASYSFLVSLL